MASKTVHYELTRFIFQRSLAFIYVCAFAILVQQFIGLCGARGLLPVRLFVKRAGFSDSPSLFFFWHSDAFMTTMAWLGLGLSLLALSRKLLTNEPSVIGLLRKNPFAERPPEFVRVRSYLYRFSDWGDDDWWKRDLRGEYLPPLSLRDEQFRKVLMDNGWFTPPNAATEVE